MRGSLMLLGLVIVAGCGGAGQSQPNVVADSADVPPDGEDAAAGSAEVSDTAIVAPPDWGPTHCPANTDEPTTGFGVGQRIGALPVKDCDTGAAATIDDACGAAATWIFVAHTHCPTCRATAGFTDDIARSYADRNVAIVQIVHDDSGVSCKTWREAYGLAGLPNVKIYADPTGAVWSALKTSNYTAPSAFLDRERTIMYKAHGLTKSAVAKQLDTALAR